MLQGTPSLGLYFGLPLVSRLGAWTTPLPCCFIFPPLTTVQFIFIVIISLVVFILTSMGMQHGHTLMHVCDCGDRGISNCPGLFLYGRTLFLHICHPKSRIVVFKIPPAPLGYPFNALKKYFIKILW